MSYQFQIQGVTSECSSCTTSPAVISYPVIEPVLPYVGKIPIKLNNYTALFIQGRLKNDATYFAVNFCLGPLESDDIAFHFNPRIGQYTAMNSCRNGSWETEESASDKPFAPGAAFYMVIVITSYGYEVYVNNQRHSTFYHRIPIEKVNAIRMVGPVNTKIIGYIQDWRNSQFFQ